MRRFSWTLWLAMLLIWLSAEEPPQAIKGGIRFERLWRAGEEYEYRLTLERLEVTTGDSLGKETYVSGGPNGVISLRLKVLPQEAQATTRKLELRILSIEGTVRELPTGEKLRADVRPFAQALSGPLVVEVNEKGEVVAVRGQELWAAVLKDAAKKLKIEELLVMAEPRWMCGAVQWCFPTLPEGPMRPGDSWETDERFAMLGGIVRLRGRNELALRVPVSGQWCHRVDAVLDVVSVDPEPPTRLGGISLESETRTCRRRVWLREHDGITVRQEIDFLLVVRLRHIEGTDRSEARISLCLELIR